MYSSTAVEIMTRLVALTLVLLAGSCYASKRIFGGVDLDIEVLPSIVQVEFQGIATGAWSQNCAGTILNNIFVLSAARCFGGTLYSPSMRRIRAGSAIRNSGGTVVPVRTAINHPDYGVASAFDADISVVRLEGFLFYSPTIQPSGIPPANANIVDGVLVSLAGWGITEAGGQPASILQYVNAFTVNRSACRETYASLPIPSEVTDNMLCTGVTGGHACSGDAGGPVVFASAVVGVVSWGHGCGDGDFPGVATLVPSYTDWIIDTTNSN